MPTPALNASFVASYSPKAHYLLAFSGGVDSVSLLLLLQKAGFRHLTLCYLNHQLRQQAAEEELFVKQCAQKFNIPYIIHTADIESYRKQKKLSIELAARQCRRQFFASCAMQAKTPYLLTAHHANDQVETLLFNLLRGSAHLRGMHLTSWQTCYGMRLCFLKPLLQEKKETLMHFVKKSGFSFCEDHTNALPFTPRNRLRHEVIPLLNSIMQRDCSDAILRASSKAKDIYYAIDTLLYEAALLDPQDRLVLSALQKLPKAFCLQALEQFLKRKGIREITSKLLERCYGLIECQNPSRVNLPRGKWLRRKNGRLFIQSAK